MHYVDDVVATSVDVHVYMLTMICFVLHIYILVRVKKVRVFALGQLVATAILQCGSRFSLFNWVVFDYCSGKYLIDLSLKTAHGDDKVHEFLNKVSNIVA